MLNFETAAHNVRIHTLSDQDHTKIISNSIHNVRISHTSPRRQDKKQVI